MPSLTEKRGTDFYGTECVAFKLQTYDFHVKVLIKETLFLHKLHDLNITDIYCGKILLGESHAFDIYLL